MFRDVNFLEHVCYCSFGGACVLMLFCELYTVKQIAFVSATFAY